MGKTTPGTDVVAQQNEQALYVPNENYRNPSREAKYQQELLKAIWGHWLDRTGSEMWQSTTLGAEAGFYQSFSGLLSVLFRTNQLFQELLLKLVLLKLPTNLQTKSILFPTSFKNTSNQIPSPIFKTLDPSYVQIKHIKLFSCELARYFNVQNLQNQLGEIEMLSKGSKVTRLNPNVKVLPTSVFNNFNLWGRRKCPTVWPLSCWPKFLKFIIIWGGFDGVFFPFLTSFFSNV